MAFDKLGYSNVCQYFLKTYHLQDYKSIFPLNWYWLIISAKMNMLNFGLILDNISHSVQPQSLKFVNLGVLGYSKNVKIHICITCE